MPSLNLYRFPTSNQMTFIKRRNLQKLACGSCQKAEKAVAIKIGTRKLPYMLSNTAQLHRFYEAAETLRLSQGLAFQLLFSITKHHAHASNA